MSRPVSASIVFLFFLLASPLDAVTMGQSDTFDSGLSGWRVGGGGTGGGDGMSSVVGPRIIEDGFDGNSLKYTTDAVATGGRFLIINSAQWSGDYATSGVTGISAVAKNEGGVALAMRLLLEGPGGNFFSLTPSTLAVGGDWQTIHFPISATDLTGGEDLGNTLAAVNQIRIFHNPDASFPGPFADAAMSIDNIRAVPEPSAGPLLLGAGILFLIRELRTSRGAA